VDEGEPRLRLATLDDADGIDQLMKVSIREIFPRFYDPRQTESAVEHIGSVDRTLIEDRTYFVVQVGGELVACGGWSRRAKLYTGSGAGVDDNRLLDPRTEPAHIRAMFTRPDWTRRGLGRRILEACEAAAAAEGFTTLSLMATLPGILLYERYGFRAIGDTQIRLPDGTPIACSNMEKPVEPLS
jgi:GNAT superfamily N-acetyltransferase